MRISSDSLLSAPNPGLHCMFYHDGKFSNHMMAHSCSSSLPKALANLVKRNHVQDAAHNKFDYDKKVSGILLLAHKFHNESNLSVEIWYNL